MPFPMLIAETPNAGPWKHRFLAEPGSGLNDAVAADYADRLRQSCNGVGRDFLGVRRETHQRSTGRPAEELLLLVGVDTSRLDEGQRGVILERLTTRLLQLDRLVEATDWSAGERLTLEKPELADWIDQSWRDLPTLPLPTEGETSKSSPLLPSPSRLPTGKLLGGVLMGALVLTGIGYLVIFREKGSPGLVSHQDEKPLGTVRRSEETPTPSSANWKKTLSEGIMGKKDPLALAVEVPTDNSDQESCKLLGDYAVEKLEADVKNSGTWSQARTLIERYKVFREAPYNRQTDLDGIEKRFLDRQDKYRYNLLKAKWNEYLEIPNLIPGNNQGAGKLRELLEGEWPKPGSAAEKAFQRVADYLKRIKAPILIDFFLVEIRFPTASTPDFKGRSLEGKVEAIKSPRPMRILFGTVMGRKSRIEVKKKLGSVEIKPDDQIVVEVAFGRDVFQGDRFLLEELPLPKGGRPKRLQFDLQLKRGMNEVTAVVALDLDVPELPLWEELAQATGGKK